MSRISRLMLIIFLILLNGPDTFVTCLGKSMKTRIALGKGKPNATILFRNNRLVNTPQQAKNGRKLIV